MKPPTVPFISGMQLLLSCVVLLSAFSFNGYAQRAAQQAPKPKTPYRLTMIECEGVDNCTNWIFLSSNGWKGYGKWRTGEEAILELESPSDGKVIIHRTDVQGSRAGLTATYTGTLHNDQVGGEFASDYQGHNSSGNWYAIMGNATVQRPPSIMHWCAQHCTTLMLDNGAPFDKPHYGSVAAGSLWTVEKFTPESVIINRTDYRPYPGTAVMTGQLSGDGNSNVNGVIRWTYHPCCGLSSGQYQAAWGSAINMVPGSDAERAAQGGQQPQTSQLSLGDVYNGAKALRDGVLELKKWSDFFQIFRSRDDQ
jgi:hypothetical protein